jgi:hypothetical protein
MGNVFLGMNIISFMMLVFLIGVGIYDLYRTFIGKQTISQKVHAWFPKLTDGIILIGIMALIWWVLGPNYFVTVLWGCIIAHFFWNTDR